MEQTKKHALHLDGRSDLVLTGVDQVLSFDDTFVELSLGDETLNVEGSDLRIFEFDSENGRLTVTGRVCALIYGEVNARKPGGFFKKRRA